jgi:serralysin
MSGTNLALESFETVFQQDLNGDGVIGLTKTVIQTDGSTSLTEIANQFYALDNSSGVGPTLQLNGAAVVVGQFGAWAPIGAVQTAGGYDVAWKNASTGLYTVWTTDSSGNHLTDTAPMLGTSYALESVETVFQQDLNGDGVIGLTKTVIQTDGSTSLTEIANQFFLDNSSGVGPALQLNGAPVVTGQFGAWAPIGAVQTAGGYDVAWKNAGLGLYTVWTVDSSGNHLTDSAGMSGTSYALESLETVFNQDLNGDGVIGLAVDSRTILNINTAAATTITFANNIGTTGELLLSDSKEFTGTIVGFTGNGTLSGSDQIDLSGLNYNSVNFSHSYSNGILTVSDGADTVKLAFTGSYSSGNFSFASDGQGGAIVYDPPTGASAQSSNNETFVFKDGLGHNPITNFQTVAANDTFVFGPGAGTSAVANAGRMDVERHNSPIFDDDHTAFFHDAGSGQTQFPFHSMNDGQVKPIDTGNLESAAAMNFHFVDLHATHFIIG